MRRRGLLLLLFLLSCVTAVAQHIVLQGRLLDARTSVPVRGATVEILSLTDTITYRAVTGVDGTFRIVRIHALGQYALLAQKTGYTDYLKVIEIDAALKDLGNVVMVDSSRLLQETLVKAKRSAFTVRGDTVEYSSSYYKTHPDMDAVYLINKMPGIDLGRMRAAGDSVTGLAINGLVIFGDGNRSRQILAQLPAGLIEKVQVYTDSTALIHPGSGRTKIINVKTVDGALRMPKGKALAGVGTSGVLNAGANAIRQRKAAQVSADAAITRGGVRNVTSYDPTYPFQSVGFPLAGWLNLNATQPLSARDQLGVDYRLYAQRNRIIRSQLDVFGLDSGGADFIRTQSDATTGQLSNGLDVKWVRTASNKARFQASSYLRLDDSDADDTVDVVSTIKGVATESHSTSQRKGRTLYTGASLTHATDARKPTSYSGMLAYSRSANDQRITTAGFNQSSLLTVPNDFVADATRHTDNFRCSFGGKTPLMPRQALAYSFSSDYAIQHAAQRRDFVSNLAGGGDQRIFDSLFSMRADYSTLNSYAEAKDGWTLDSGRVSLEVGSGLRYFEIREKSGSFSKDYFTFNPFVRFSKRYGAQKELTAQLEKKNELPAYDELAPIIVATTPSFYRAGNLNLRPSQRFDFSVFYKSKFILKESFFNARTSAIYIRNNIVQSLILPGAVPYVFEGRPIPVGVQLSYARNFGDYRYVYSGFEFDAPLSWIKTVVKFRTNVQLRSTEALLNGEPVATTSYTYSASSAFHSTISERFDFVVYAAYDFDRSVQRGGEDVTSRDIHRILLNSLLTVQVSKRQTLKAETNINSTSGLPTTRPTRFYLLDFSYSIKALRSQKLSFSTTLHDALNSYKAFGFEYRANAVHSFESNAVGRYLLVAVGYTF